MIKAVYVAFAFFATEDDCLGFVAHHELGKDWEVQCQWTVLYTNGLDVSLRPKARPEHLTKKGDE